MAESSHSEMPFLDHLEELRWRLFRVALALAVGVIGAFTLFSLGTVDIVAMLAEPVKPFLNAENGGKLIFTHPSDMFDIVLNASIALGVVFASPVIAWQIWGFLSPAMYKHEKTVVIPVLIGAMVLFLAGMALSFYIVLPFTLKFLLTGFKSDAVTNMLSAHDFFGFEIAMCLAFGAVFELPILILLLTALGLVNPRMLTRFRRHAFVACIVGAALITPGSDPTSLFALTLPLYLLYELSIVLSLGVHKRREKRLASQALESLA